MDGDKGRQGRIALQKEAAKDQEKAGSDGAADEICPFDKTCQLFFVHLITNSMGQWSEPGTSCSIWALTSLSAILSSAKK